MTTEADKPTVAEVTLPDIDSTISPPPDVQFMWAEIPEIVKLGDPVLRKVAPPVKHCNRETQATVKRMIDIMRKANGLGLAAPQIGLSTRIFVYDAGDGDGVQVMINPVIQSRKGLQTDPPEGCLSIPGLQGVVPRSESIRVTAFDERGRSQTKRVSGLEARIIQHELDHLDGILFIDHADPDSLTWLVDDDEEGSPHAPRE